MSNLQDMLVREQVEYERALCASVLVPGEANILVERIGWLTGSMFADAKLGEFWDCVKEGRSPTECATELGVYLDIVKTMTDIPSVIYPEEYAQAIGNMIHLRDAADTAIEVVDAVADRDVGKLRASIDALKNLPDRYGGANRMMHTADIDNELREMVASEQVSIKTGIDELDYVLGGLSKGDLSIVAGRPGIGKTSIATEIARKIAERKQHKVLLFSVEMPRLQLWGRMACGDAGVTWRALRGGELTPEQVEAVLTRSAELSAELGDYLCIEDMTWDVPTMIEKAYVYKPDIVIVDHLGEIKWHERGLEEMVWFGRAAKMLRSEIARRMGVHVMLLHQINRGVESRQDKRPLMSDLRMSGELEQLADVVLMLYREDYYASIEGGSPVSQSQTEVPMEIWVRKNRQGAMNSVATVGFNTQNQRFFHMIDINDMLHAIAKT